MTKILVVDNDEQAIDLLRNLLGEAGYEISVARDGVEAIKKTDFHNPDLIILDVVLPVFDGFEVCRKVKSNPTTMSIPTVLLTAKSSEVDRVLGFEMGADDYILKPYNPRELLLRIRNLLKRNQHSSRLEDREIFHVGNVHLDLGKREVLVEEKEIKLTPKEFNLLSALIKSRGKVLSRDKLLQEVWGYDNLVDSRTVDTHIRRLRNKLGIGAAFLTTIRGVGYRVEEF